MTHNWKYLSKLSIWSEFSPFREWFSSSIWNKYLSDEINSFLEMPLALHRLEEESSWIKIGKTVITKPCRIYSMHSQCQTCVEIHKLWKQKGKRSRLKLQNCFKIRVVKSLTISSSSTIFISYQGTHWTLFKIQNKREKEKVVSVLCELNYCSFHHPDRCLIGGHPKCVLHAFTSGFLSKGKQWLGGADADLHLTSALEILSVISIAFEFSKTKIKKKNLLITIITPQMMKRIGFLLVVAVVLVFLPRVVEYKGKDIREQNRLSGLIWHTYT